LMNKFGAPGTPALVWKDRGDVRFKVGVPRLSELPQITGLPAQPNDDPELAKFR
jgi:thiol:disulfide interchange protein DsbG